MAILLASQLHKYHGTLASAVFVLAFRGTVVRDCPVDRLHFLVVMLTSCNASLASLDQEDGHNQCPLCLGIEYLRPGLMGNACTSCSCIMLAERATRLARLRNSGAEALPPVGMSLFSPRAGTRCHRSAQGDSSHAKKKSKHDDPLALKVDSLASEFV